MVAALSYLASTIQDRVVQAILIGVVAMLGWNAYEMRATRVAILATREDFNLHAMNMNALMGPTSIREVMAPTNQVMSIVLAKQGDRAGTPAIYKWIDDYEQSLGPDGRLARIEKNVDDLGKNQGGLKNQLDRVLQILEPKGKKP